MCGRVRLSSDVSEIRLVFGIPPERLTFLAQIQSFSGLLRQGVVTVFP